MRAWWNLIMTYAGKEIIKMKWSLDRGLAANPSPPRGAPFGPTLNFRQGAVSDPHALPSHPSLLSAS